MAKLSDEEVYEYLRDDLRGYLENAWSELDDALASEGEDEWSDIVGNCATLKDLVADAMEVAEKLEDLQEAIEREQVEEDSV